MSSVTDTQRKNLIIAQVGDELTTAFPTGIVKENIDLLWLMYGFAATIDVSLRDSLVRRESLKLLLGYLRNSVNVHISGDSSVDSHQRVQTLENMLTETIAEISRYSISLISGSVEIGLLTTTAPDAPPFSQTPDANFKGYGGDPYYSTLRRTRR